jgi:hypothetical protein
MTPSDDKLVADLAPAATVANEKAVEAHANGEIADKTNVFD